MAASDDPVNLGAGAVQAPAGAANFESLERNFLEATTPQDRAAALKAIWDAGFSIQAGAVEQGNNRFVPVRYGAGAPQFLGPINSQQMTAIETFLDDYPPNMMNPNTPRAGINPPPPGPSEPPPAPAASLPPIDATPLIRAFSDATNPEARRTALEALQSSGFQIAEPQAQGDQFTVLLRREGQAPQVIPNLDEEARLAIAEHRVRHPQSATPAPAAPADGPPPTATALTVEVTQGDRPAPIFAGGAVGGEFKIGASQVDDVQRVLIAATGVQGIGSGANPNEPDGKWGARTRAAFEAFCRDHNIDPTKVDFTNPDDPETKKFMEEASKAANARATDRTGEHATAAAPQDPPAEREAPPPAPNPMLAIFTEAGRAQFDTRVDGDRTRADYMLAEIAVDAINSNDRNRTTSGIANWNLDGRAGRDSRDAIQDFQRANGLQVDGRIDSVEDWKKLSDVMRANPEAMAQFGEQMTRGGASAAEVRQATSVIEVAAPSAVRVVDIGHGGDRGLISL